MILGRPTNLWTGALVTLVSFLVVVALQLFPDVDGEVIATIGASFTGFMGAVILLVANQSPTVHAGDEVKVITPAGQDNYTTTV